MSVGALAVTVRNLRTAYWAFINWFTTANAQILTP
jgi:hypothetical protein